MNAHVINASCLEGDSENESIKLMTMKKNK